MREQLTIIYEIEGNVWGGYIEQRICETLITSMAATQQELLSNFIMQLVDFSQNEWKGDSRWGKMNIDEIEFTWKEMGPEHYE